MHRVKWGNSLFQDILCLVRWVGVRHAVGPSGTRDRPGTERRRGHPHTTGRDGLYPVAGHRVVTNTMWYGEHQSRCVRGGSNRRKVSESRIVGYGSHLGDDGAGASLNGGGDDVDSGESAGLARKLLPVM
jgi:hypothetical protein